MVLDITSGSLTAVVGLVGILLGALIGPFTNHRLGATYSRRDLIFKRKLEYFEKVVETMERNKKMYHNALCKIQNSKNKKETENIILELKQNRNNFFIMASPLYFNTRRFSDEIVSFVDIEKNIFENISKIRSNNKETIEKIKEDLEGLNRKSKEIIFDMKRELKK